MSGNSKLLASITIGRLSLYLYTGWEWWIMNTNYSIDINFAWFGMMWKHRR